MGLVQPKRIVLKNGVEVCLRTPVVEDAQKVLEYLKMIFENDRFYLTTAEEAKEWQTIEKQQERIQTYYDDENKLLVVTEIDGHIVSLSDIECGGKKRIRHVGRLGISILPEYRGAGLGTAIMETMIEWAQQHPIIEKLALGVWSANEPAIRLYKKMGFIEEGRKVREVKYADGSYDDCVCMYRFV